MNKADTTLFLTIGVVMGIIIGVSLGIRPLWARYGRLQAEKIETKKELAELTERANMLKALAGRETEVKEIGRQVLVYLPTDIASAPFVMDIAAMAGKSKTNVITLSFQEPPAKKGATVTEYPLTMSVEGNWQDLTTFLRFLEENLRFSAFSALSFAQQKDGLLLQLSGTLYSKSEETEFKDRSLTIKDDVVNLLKSRQIFGRSIDPSGPGRSDPFAPF